jgi:membrane associated rhomboid family serine protease
VERQLERTRGAGLIGSPGAPRFSPASLIADLPEGTRFLLARNQERLARFLAAFALVLIPVAVVSGVHPFAGLASLLAGLGIVVARDARKHLRDPRTAADRTLFLHWLARSSASRRRSALWLGAGLLIGVGQWTLMHAAGGIETAFERYGLIYARFEAGEHWRLLTGPWLHVSIEHYIGNLILVTGVGTLASSVSPRLSPALFLIGAPVSLWLQLELGPRGLGGAAGMSGGLFTLLGFLATAGVGVRHRLPRGLPVLVAAAAILSIAFPLIFHQPSGHVAHVGGVLLGAAVGATAARNDGRRADLTGVDGGDVAQPPRRSG